MFTLFILPVQNKRLCLIDSDKHRPTTEEQHLQIGDEINNGDVSQDTVCRS